MTVLWVTFGLPYPPDYGGRQRDFYLIREVARQARIILFSLIPPGGATDASELRKLCEAIVTWQMPEKFPPFHLLTRISAGAWVNFYPEAAARITELVRAEKPDVVQIEHSLLAAYVDAVPASLKCRTVLSFHNVAFEQYRRFARLDSKPHARAGYVLKSWLMRRAEAHYAKKCDYCVTVSEAESNQLRRLLPSVQVEIIENGVDCEAHRPLPGGGRALLFAGLMKYPPNEDAALYFCRSIFPLIRLGNPDVRVLIVGHSPSARVKQLVSMPGVTVTGGVEDVVPYYAQTGITIVPLRAGGGTRLKILESMALGRPVVSTSIGCEGLEVKHDRDLLIADAPEEFAKCVNSLLGNPDLRDRLATAARRLVESRYDWREIGKRLAEIHQNHLAEPAHPR